MNYFTTLMRLYYQYYLALTAKLFVARIYNQSGIHSGHKQSEKIYIKISRYIKNLIYDK